VVVMVSTASLGRTCPHLFDKTAHRIVRLARLTFHRAGLSDY
jgi:hypothetical protein